MTTILSIQSSINGNHSMSRKLTNEIIDQLKKYYPDAVVKERDLAVNPVPHLDSNDFLALRTAPAERTQTQEAAAVYANALVDEVFAADFIVIGVPFYNFHIPSTLKSWLDHIAVPGRTFSYASGKPEGLVKDKKVFLAIAMGGVYSEEPLTALDSTEPYLRSFLAFIGMKDVTVVKAEGLAVAALREQNLQKAMTAIEEFSY